MVPTTYGGADKFGWNPKLKDPVVDIAAGLSGETHRLVSGNAYKRPKVRLRLHQSLIKTLGVEQSVKEKLNGLLRFVLTAAKTEDADAWPPAQRFLLALMEYMSDAAHRAVIKAVLDMKKKPKIESYPQHQGVVVMGAVELPPVEAALRRILSTKNRRVMRPHFH